MLSPPLADKVPPGPLPPHFTHKMKYGRWETLDRPKMMAYGPLRLLEPGQLILGTFIFDVFWRHMGSIWEATLAVGGKSWSRMLLLSFWKVAFGHLLF